MAIFQPTNIIPSTFSGVAESTISPSDNVEISWQVNGNSPMTSYKIDIMNNDSSGTVIFTTGIVNIFSSPFYPTDQNGVPQRFTYSSVSTWDDIGIVAGNEYKLSITQYWDFLTTPTLVEQYSPAVFRARTPPSLSINSFANPITSVGGTFTATYSQNQDDAISWARWVLSNTSGTVADTGKIPTSLLKFDYDGFLNGENYTLTLTVETESGVTATATADFDIEYLSPTVLGGIDISCTEDNAVLVKWPQVNNYTGVPTPSTNYGTFVSGSLLLNYGASVLWDFQTQAPFSVLLGGQLNVDPAVSQLNLTLLNLGDLTIKVVQSGNTNIFVYRESLIIGQISLDYRYNIFSYYIAFNSNGELVFKFSDGSLETSLQLSNAVPILQVLLSNDSLSAAKYYDYIYISENDNYDLNSVMVGNKPAIDTNTLFFADFSRQNLQGGLYNGTENPSARVYRQDENILTFLATVPYGTNSLKDYGVKSKSTPSYQVMYKSGQTFTHALISESHCFRYNAYNLIEAMQSSENPNQYEVLKTWVFGSNVEAGSVSNNNAPSLIENFTKYPYRQPSSQAAKSGVLQALIQNVSNGAYSDSAADMEALFAISQSTNTFFLKDMKGNLYMVHTSGPITQTVNNKSAVQEVTVSIPWQEIGDAEGLAIVGGI